MKTKIGRTIATLAIALLAIAMSLVGCKKQAADSGAGGEKAEASSPEAVAVEMTQAATRSIDITVAAQGTLVAAQGATARVAPIAAGRLTEVRVREGDRVTAGQVVALLDNRVQAAQARSASAALTASEAQARQAALAAQAAQTDQAGSVRLAQLSLSAAQIDRDSSVRLAKSTLTAAETDLKKTQSGARPQELALATQAVAQAKATRDRASTEIERTQFLYEKGIAARRQLDDARAAFSVAESALESARQQESLVRAGARSEDLRAAEIRVEQAKDSVNQAQASGDAKVAQAQAALRQARQAAIQVDVKRQEAAAFRDSAAQKRADLAAAQVGAATTELRSPIAGIVTRRTLNPGDMADPAGIVIEVANSNTLNLAANLAADENAKVRAGMRVRITTGDGSNAHGGRVLSVGQVDPQTNLLSVRIEVVNSDGALKAGQFANAEIVLRTEPTAVVVPKQATLTKDGKQVVFEVGSDGVAHQKEIEVGVEQGEFVEVTRGLTAGTRVVLLGQYELTDGAKVKEAEKAEAPEKTDKAGTASGDDKK